MREGSEHLIWRKSSRCGTSACVEVAAGRKTVHLRNSQDPAARRLVFSHEEWASFVAGVKAGDFDLLSE
jgi:hypothetical protein